MIAKRLLLFVIKFMLIFPASVYAEYDQEDINEMMRMSEEATGAGRRPGHTHVQPNPEGSDVVGAAATRAGSSVLLNITSNLTHNISRGINNSISIIDSEVYNEILLNQLRINTMIDQGVDEVTHLGVVFNKGVLIRQQEQLTNQLCRDLGTQKDQLMGLGYSLKRGDHGSDTVEENIRNKNFPPRTANFFTDVDGFATWADSALRNSLNSDSKERTSTENQRLGHDLLLGLGNSFSDACATYSRKNGSYCEGASSESFSQVCKDYFKYISDPEAADNILNDQSKSSTPVGFAAYHATEFVDDFQITDAPDSNKNTENDKVAHDVRSDANNIIVETNGKTYSCNKRDANCFFRAGEGVTNFENGSVCDDFQCSLVGDAQAAFNGDNAEIMQVLTGISSANTNLNPLGDDSYCTSCLNEKFRRLSNSDFGDVRDEVSQKVNEKMMEKVSERIIYDHVGYLEGLLDRSNLMGDNQMMDGSMPNDMFCMDELNSALDLSSCGNRVPQAYKDRVKERNKKLLVKVLRGMGASINERNISGERIISELTELSNELKETKCDGDDKALGLDGRDLYALKKFDSWNDSKANKQTVNDLMNTFITVNGVQNSPQRENFSQICSRNPASLNDLDAPIEKLSDMTASYMSMYMERLDNDSLGDNKLTCNMSSDANNTLGFNQQSIFHDALCGDNNSFNSLASAVDDINNNSPEFLSYKNKLPADIRDAALDSESGKIIKEGYLKRKAREVVAAGMNMDPRLNTVFGSWQNLCGTYSAYQNSSNPVDFDNYVKALPELYEGERAQHLVNIRDTNCKKLNTKLKAVMCEPIFKLPSDQGNIVSIGGVKYNSEDLAQAVEEVGGDLNEEEKIALASYSCGIRSEMIRNQLTQDGSERVDNASNEGLLSSIENRSPGEVSDLELSKNDRLADKIRPNFNEDLLCNETANCRNYRTAQRSFKLKDRTCNSNGNQNPYIGDTNDSSGSSNGESGLGPGGTIYFESNELAYDKPSGNNVGGSGGSTSSNNGNNPSGSNNPYIASGDTPATGGLGAGGKFQAGNISEDSNTELAANSGSDLLAAFQNADGSMGAFNANGMQGSTTASNFNGSYNRQVRALQDRQRDEIEQDQSSGGPSRGPASVEDSSDLDIANMSESELRALSDRLGINMDELRNNNSKSLDEVKEEDSALSRLLAEMQNQNKSNQEIIEKLQAQNDGLTSRLSRIENAASDSRKNSGSVNVEGSSISPSAAFSNNQFAFDLGSNSFQQSASIPDFERKSFSPDFASTGQNLSAANFSSYSDTRRSAIRSRDSDVNREFLTLVAGESASYDAVETNPENVERYVDFINQRGGVVHLVRYDQSGRPVSIKVPWSTQEIELTGAYANLISKIPPQSEALEAEEADYGMYKMVEFGLSLEQFFATEASEQVQLSSLINELDSAEVR